MGNINGKVTSDQMPLVPMPFEVVCGGCGSRLYFGKEVKPLDLLLRSKNYKCDGCGVLLSKDFTVEVCDPSIILAYSKTSALLTSIT